MDVVMVCLDGLAAGESFTVPDKAPFVYQVSKGFQVEFYAEVSRDGDTVQVQVI